MPTARASRWLLAPIYFLLAITDAWGRAATGRGTMRFASNLLLAGGQALLAVLVVWACYNFRFSPQGAGAPPLDALGSDWAEALAYSGGSGVLVEHARQWRVLPEAWLYGLGNVLAGA